jgi:hypothetical protein
VRPATVTAAAELPGDEILERLDQLVAGPGNTVIYGAAGSGKTHTLISLAGRLNDRETRCVVLSPPAGALDAAGAVLAQLADTLGSKVLTDRVADASGSLVGKVADVLNALDGATDVVLMLDEPLQWAAGGEADDGQARRLAAALLSRFPGPIVATATAPDQWLSASEAFRLPSRSTTPPPLRRTNETRIDEPDLIGDAARLTAQWMGELALGLSPLSARLAVAYVALADGPPTRMVAEDRRALSSALREHLATHRQHHALRDAWVHLALARQPTDETGLAALAVPPPDTLAGQVLRHCLLSPAITGHELHPTLRSDVQAGGPRREVHRRLAGVYAQRAAGGRLVDLVEAAHHARRSGDPDLVARFPVLFAEQLDLLGRWQSQTEEDPATAAETFRESLALSPGRSYPQHYLAYNLDLQGEEPDEVEVNYSTAIAGQPHNAWWHSRYLNFLLTRRRVDDARAAWHAALDELADIAQPPDRPLYSSLHQWVARLALFFGDLDLCEEILRDVPAEVRQQSTMLRAIGRRVQARREIEHYDGAFRPLRRLQPGWWREGPERLLPQLPNGEVLRDWLAGRIESVAEGVVAVRGTRVSVPAPDEHPPVVIVRFDEATFIRGVGAANGVAAGRFVEVGQYVNGRPEHVLEVTALLDVDRDDQLAPPQPDPRRYVRARVARRRRARPGPS